MGEAKPLTRDRKVFEFPKDRKPANEIASEVTVKFDGIKDHQLAGRTHAAH